jgi:hypothetical protein
MYTRYTDGTGAPYYFDYEHLHDIDASIRADVTREIELAQRAVDTLIGTTGAGSFEITSGGRNIPYNPATEEAQKTIGSYYGSRT